MAAGLGFKTFNTGDILTAADTNGYLMQGVWVFANAAARTSAVSSPEEGNVSFLKDTNSLEIYDGAAWVAYGAGDITGVTAGTGISGGGTAGTVTITNSMATAIDAKGDLIVGTGADTFARLAVGGTNGHVLTVNSSTATGLAWAAAAGGGKILQVVQGTTTSQVSSTSTTFADTGVSATITPASTGSKILIFAMHKTYKSNQNAGNGCDIRIMRDATALFTHTSYGYTNSTLDNMFSIHLSYVDSPNTTSAITYKTQFRNRVAANLVNINSDNEMGTIIVMEIGA